MTDCNRCCTYNILCTHTRTHIHTKHTHTHTHTQLHHPAPHCTTLQHTWRVYRNLQSILYIQFISQCARRDVTCRMLETAGLYKFSSRLVCHCNMQKVGFRVCVRVVVHVLCQPCTGIQTCCNALQHRATHCTTHTLQRTAYVIVMRRRMYKSL